MKAKIFDIAKKEVANAYHPNKEAIEVYASPNNS